MLPKTLASTAPVTAGDINIVHARTIADQQITYVVEFAGTLDPDRLNGALARLVEALPILSAVVAVEGRRFRRAPAPGYRPAVTVEDAGEAAPEAVARFIGRPCDPEREPPLKLHRVRAAGCDTLCLKADHVLTDAGGLKRLLYALAEGYATGQISAAFHPDRGLGQVFRRFSPLALGRAAARANLPRPGPTLIAGPFDAQPLFIERVSVEGAAFERVRAAARRAGATLNDLLLAAVYRAVWQRQAPGPAAPYPIMVPVDMRRYLPEGEQCLVGNLSSAVYPALAAVPGEPLAQTLARVTAAMAAFKRDNPGLASLLLMAVGALQGGRLMRDRYRLAATRGSRFINLTNFGVIDAAQCAFGVPLAQAYGVGPIQYAPGSLIAVSSFGGTLHLVLQGNDAGRFQPFIRGFLQSVRAELRACEAAGLG